MGAGALIELPTRKARALLAYLALHPDEVIPRQSLTGLLWSDRGEPQANNSLSQAVTALRKALAGTSPAPLIVEPDSLKLAGDAISVDVAAFEALARSDERDDLVEAERLYRGALLQGLGVRDPAFEEWLEFERQRLHALAVDALTRLVGLPWPRELRDDLAAIAQRLVKLDPLQETGHRALMRSYAEQGQIGLALGQYETCAAVLKRELGVAPETETQRLRDGIVGQRERSAAADDAPDEPSATPAAPRPTSRVWPRSLRMRHLLATVVLLIVGAIGTWLVEQGKDARPPSLIVLPFSNTGATQEPQPFADGMTEDLITHLSRMQDLLVISRNTAMVYKGRDVRPRAVAAELGVRYVLEGSVQRSGDQLRVHARLIDAELESNLWADSFDGTTANVFGLQDRITERIVSALADEVLLPDDRPERRAGTANVAALDAFNMGRHHYYRRTPEANARAAEHLTRAIALDPGFTEAHTALAKVYVRAAIGEQAYADALGIFWTEGFTRSARLVEKGMAQPNADAHVLRSWLALRNHQPMQAIAAAEAGLALNPNDAEAREALAEALIYAGRPREGIAHAQRAMELNPLLLGRPLYLLGLAAFARGNPEDAVTQAERAIEAAPARAAEASGLLAASYGELGRDKQAKRAIDAYEASLVDRPALAWSVEPQAFANPRSHTWWRVDLAWAVYAHPFVDREIQERLAAGLEIAGATSGIGGYLPLHSGTRLSGDEIRTLLFGASIEGNGFRAGEDAWRQVRDGNGVVRHGGHPVHPGLDGAVSGVGRIDGDRLCDHWPGRAAARETCVAIFRIPRSAARLRWGDYVMVTDTGPHPFSVVE